MTANEKRQSIINNSKLMLGRNVYNQLLRAYALTPYKDGRYYSDCSSFVIAALKSAGIDINWMNSYGIKTSNLFTTIIVDYEDYKHIKNANVILRIADIIVWDGHVEMVHSIVNAIVYVQGHGSDTPKVQKLYDIEKWNYGKPMVRRIIMDDTVTPPDSPNDKNILYCVQCGAFRNKEYAKNLQTRLINSGFSTFITDIGDGLYRVQIGAYALKENADKQLQLVKDAGFSDAYVRIKNIS